VRGVIDMGDYFRIPFDAHSEIFDAVCSLLVLKCLKLFSNASDQIRDALEAFTIVECHIVLCNIPSENARTVSGMSWAQTNAMCSLGAQ
jgi:3-dehydroquinate dehydratase